MAKQVNLSGLAHATRKLANADIGSYVKLGLREGYVAVFSGAPFPRTQYPLLGL
jgi:hypothetical protein